MKSLLWMALLAVPATAQELSGVPAGPTAYVSRDDIRPEVADLTCSYLQVETDYMFEARLVGGFGDWFELYLQLGHSGVFRPANAYSMGRAPLDATGFGVMGIPLPDVRGLPRNFEIEVFGVYKGQLGEPMVTEPAYFRLNQAPEERFDPGWGLRDVRYGGIGERPFWVEGDRRDAEVVGDDVIHPQVGSVALPAGTRIREQWADIGMHIRACNGYSLDLPGCWTGHPDEAILFDSVHPTGGDFDLVTPGYGWMNDVAFDKLLIIAENDVDRNGDGRVDVPDDEARGGTLFFDFDHPVTLGEMTLVDIDLYETVAIRCFDGVELVQDIQFAGRGDNSKIVIGFAANPVSRIEVELSGSGAIAGLTFSMCATVLDFDEFTTGVPVGLPTGTILGDQFEAPHGFAVSARSNAPGTDRAILFDTAAWSGNDSDLETPGYHPTNVYPYRKVMILANDLVDENGDGLVDDPDDDSRGGVLVFEFEYDVLFQAATVIDIDANETAWFDLYDGEGAYLGVVPLVPLGDNSVQTVDPAIAGVRRIELWLSGSGALADLVFCRDDS